jgi:archaellum component FlaC
MSEGGRPIEMIEAPAFGVRKQVEELHEMIKRLVSLNDTHTRAALTLMERHKLQHQDVVGLNQTMNHNNKVLLEGIKALQDAMDLMNKRMTYIEDRLLSIEQNLGLLG